MTPTPTPTFESVRIALKALGIRIKLIDSLYCLNYRFGRRHTAYYTNDLNDALEQGRIMGEVK